LSQHPGQAALQLYSLGNLGSWKARKNSRHRYTELLPGQIAIEVYVDNFAGVELWLTDTNPAEMFLFHMWKTSIIYRDQIDFIVVPAFVHLL
jgi:hypothetical protein